MSWPLRFHLVSLVRLVYVQSLTFFQVAQLSLIAFGLAFTAVQLRRTARAARVANLLTLTKNHRELWTMLLSDENLRSIILSGREVESIKDLTFEEQQMINFFLLHMATAFELHRFGLITRNGASATDIAALMNLPMFSAMWEEYQQYHTKSFRRYVNRGFRRLDRKVRKAQKRKSQTSDGR